MKNAGILQFSVKARLMLTTLKKNLSFHLEGHYSLLGLSGFVVLFVLLFALFEVQYEAVSPTKVATIYDDRATVVSEVIGTSTAMDKPAVVEVPSSTPTPLPAPVRSSAVPTGETVATVSTRDIDSNEIYLPVYINPSSPTPAPTETPFPTPTPTIDFKAVRAQLLQEGNDLGFVKIGFHTGSGGNRNGISIWMHRLDEAGVPFFIKTVDDSGPLVEAQDIVRNSDVPHTLVYRRSGNEYDTPNYDLPPAQAAREHWQLHREAFPPELDPSLIWIETINEVDRNRSEWLGQFAVETAQLAMADGFKWAAFGWSSGEPEVQDWQLPSMMQFLRLAGANPDQVAIAVHEYSYKVDEITHEYPYKIGRFQLLYQVADQAGIPRPTLLITEWGWEYSRVPSQDEAIRDIHWAADLYSDYPEIKGAAIWYLGGGFMGIAEMTQKLIVPLTEYSLGTYFAIPLPPDQAPINPAQYQP